MAPPAAWRPTWSHAAAVRALRATVVVPPLFALAFKVIGNLQMATFVGFGGFATLVMAGFGGSRRDKLIAHTALAVAGSVLLAIGTLVNSSVALAAVVTLPVTFLVFFVGVAGPSAASGVTAALLAYVLPAASPGTAAMIPDRLAGWWLVTVAGTIAVLVSSPQRVQEPLRADNARLLAALADEIEAMLAGAAGPETRAVTVQAKQAMLSRFTATPFRPTGLASADQALANAVELLEWAAALVGDMVRERDDLRGAAPVDRDLLAGAAAVLRDSGRLLTTGEARPDLDRLEALRAASHERLGGLESDDPEFEEHARVAFHAEALALTALALGADALVAARLVDADWLIEARTRWFIDSSTRLPIPERHLSGLFRAAARHATVRSVWFVNSLRGAIALAAAVAVADLTSVQHGFWVVLGALSVLRTNAASTGSTALRALAGTLVGFVLGAALVLAIGTSHTALWIAFPIAVAVASYSPGTAPFAVGQAAFTVLLVVLFNLLVPVGWKVGALRVEDVAIGAAVSLIVGSLFWPRGVAGIVGDDLADAYRSGATYLEQALGAICTRLPRRPNAAARAITAAVRLDYALRGFLAEQGTKHVSKAELWRLVGGTIRLRLTAHAVAQLPQDGDADVAARSALMRRAAVLEAWYGELAALLGPPRGAPVPELVAPQLDGGKAAGAARSQELVWLAENLDHLAEHLGELIAPATRVAHLRRRPWWR